MISNCWSSPAKHRLDSLAVVVFAWFPCAGLFVLLSEMAAVTREEIHFSSVLREIRQLDLDTALQSLRRDSTEKPAGPSGALRAPGLVVVRTGDHGESVTPWSGTVGRISRRAGKVAELETVVVVYRLDHELAYVLIDWPRRRAIEWASWTDIPNRHVASMCSAYKGPHFPCVRLLEGGPQWDPLLAQLGGYEPPLSIETSTLMTWALLYVMGMFILFLGLTIVEARTLREELASR